jgi:tetratricopeptide (TPR) repeat protein
MDIAAMVEVVIKLVIFLPIVTIIGFWLFTAWFVDKTLVTEEFVIGLALLFGAFALGVKSIESGGWGFMGVLGVVYVALLMLAAWEYIYWRRAEMQHLREEVARYQHAIDIDPTAIAAYSLLGQTYLKLSRFEEAEEMLRKAVEMDPEARAERRLLERARLRQGGPPRWWSD